MALSNAEHQRRFRQRRRQERLAEQVRAEIRALLAFSRDPACDCCGEARIAFLTLRNGKVHCANCRKVIDSGGLCPHQGVDGRLR